LPHHPQVLADKAPHQDSTLQEDRSSLMNDEGKLVIQEVILRMQYNPSNIPIERKVKARYGVEGEFGTSDQILFMINCITGIRAEQKELKILHVLKYKYIQRNLRAPVSFPGVHRVIDTF
jgi:hypothetical protein